VLSFGSANPEDQPKLESVALDRDSEEDEWIVHRCKHHLYLAKKKNSLLDIGYESLQTTTNIPAMVVGKKNLNIIGQQNQILVVIL
jgi:hypothetical protein